MGEYLILEGDDLEKILSFDGVQVRCSWGSPRVRLYRQGTTPWVWDAVVAGQKKRREARISYDTTSSGRLTG